MKFLVRFDKAKGIDQSRVGGKGYSLIKLTSNDFKVPNGFVATTDALEAVLDANGLKKEVEGLLQGINVNNARERSQTLKDIIQNAKVPENLLMEINDALSELNSKFIFARSSAIGEDSAASSYAGMHDSYFCERADTGKVIENIKRCWASLFNSRVLVYKMNKNIPIFTTSKMAVVLQEAIPADTAGVIFTVRVDTGDNDSMILEATWGLGESLVSGSVTPDRFIINREDLGITEKVIGEKGTMKSLKPDGSGDSITPKEKRCLLCIDDGTVRSLASIALQIERLYGSPQDVEWCVTGKTIWVVQARPITTLRTRTRKWKKIVAREYGVQYAEVSLKSISPMNQGTVPFTFYEQVYVPEDGNEACYFEEGKWLEFISALKARYFGNTSDYEQFDKGFIESGEAYVEVAKRISKSDLTKLSNKELSNLFSDLSRKNVAYAPFIWMQFIINNFYAEKVQEIVENKIGKNNRDILQYMQVALRPNLKAGAMALNEVAARWDKLSKKEKEDAFNRFRWMPCMDIHNPPWSIEQFYEQMEGLRTKEKEKIKDYGPLFEKLTFDGQEKRIISIAKRLAYEKGGLEGSRKLA
jgi:pyruvate,water dikinase